jgi:hypothetical protein
MGERRHFRFEIETCVCECSVSAPFSQSSPMSGNSSIRYYCVQFFSLYIGEIHRNYNHAQNTGNLCISQPSKCINIWRSYKPNVHTHTFVHMKNEKYSFPRLLSDAESSKSNALSSLPIYLATTAVYSDGWKRQNKYSRKSQFPLNYRI